MARATDEEILAAARVLRAARQEEKERFDAKIAAERSWTDCRDAHEGACDASKAARRELDRLLEMRDDPISKAA